MNVHTVIEDLLEPYLADGLEATERQAVERHAHDCTECSAALADAQEFSNFLRDALEPMRPPADLETRIIRGLRAEGVEPKQVSIVSLPPSEAQERNDLRSAQRNKCGNRKPGDDVPRQPPSKTSPASRE